jgi:hypothetical protein
MHLYVKKVVAFFLSLFFFRLSSEVAFARVGRVARAFRRNEPRSSAMPIERPRKPQMRSRQSRPRVASARGVAVSRGVREVRGRGR